MPVTLPPLDRLGPNDAGARTTVLLAMDEFLKGAWDGAALLPLLRHARTDASLQRPEGFGGEAPAPHAHALLALVRRASCWGGDGDESEGVFTVNKLDAMKAGEENVVLTTWEGHALGLLFRRLADDSTDSFEIALTNSGDGCD